MFEKKIKFVWGCGASRQYESISISKNKAPRLLLQMVNSSSFRHYYCFYYHSQCFRIKKKFVFGGVVLADSPKVVVVVVVVVVLVEVNEILLPLVVAAGTVSRSMKFQQRDWRE